MKTGIITLHSNTNYGGGLQQIALFETLRSLGHEVQFLCVQNGCQNGVHNGMRSISRPSKIQRLFGILTSYSPRQLLNAAEEGYRRFTSKPAPFTPNTGLYEATDKFNYTHLNYTPKFGVAELPSYVSNCDALIYGSDQVWTDVYSPVLPYFGDGIEDYKGKKIAYAACSAHHKAPLYNRRKIGKLLTEFDAVSVRDETTRQLVRRHSTINPPIVCDPTLLYDFKAYLKTSPVKGAYIFAYVLGDKTAQWHRRNIEYIKDKIKGKTGAVKVVALTTQLDDKLPWADEVITDALAVDWMNILREAAFVYTNSFHAVLFSLKFHRQFVAYYGDMVRSSRMVGLRSQFGLESRIVKNPLAVDLNINFEFAATDAIINQLASESLAFLRNSLQ